jgi:hypothetical protein
MPRILLANEFGAGRGHLVTLTRLAQAFGPPFTFDAALCEREHERELRSLNATVFNGSRLVYQPARRTGPDAVPTATWGEYLGDLGFDQVSRLRELIVWWRQVLQERRVSLVLADYAPLALMAARSLGIPTIATGQGYGLPPADMPEFPVLDPERSQRLHDERVLLANVNAVASDIGLPALRGLPEVYRADLTLVNTLPLLDPYARWRKEPCMAPLTDIGSVLAQDGDEVFVYFSTREFENPAVLEALATLPLPRRGFFPALPAGVAERLSASGMVLESAPVSADDIARRSRLILNAGQHGILSLGLFAGLAQVCLPQHQEQLHHARCAEAAGVARVVGNGPDAKAALYDTVMAAYSDAGLALHARALARSLREGLGDWPSQQLARAVAPLRQALLSAG